MFPDTSIGRINHARSIIVAAFEDLFGNKLVQFERRQRRNLGWEVIVAGSLATNSGIWQNKVTDLGRPLQSAAFAEEQHAFRLNCTEQVHDGCCIRRANAEVDNGQAVTVGCRLHRFGFPLDVAVEHVRELVDIVSEVG